MFKSKILFLLCVVCCLFPANVSAQEYTHWGRQARSLPDSFFVGTSVQQPLINVLASQLPCGGWSKNINFFSEREEHPDDNLRATIDNDATSTEIRFLFRYIEHNKHRGRHDALSERVVEAALRGLRYLLQMQYPNGGFPQYYPRTDHYHAHITFNDNAMVNVLKLLRQVARRDYPFGTVSAELARLCESSFHRGISCILRSQIVRDGRPTVWCQQHHEVTLQPVPARSFELASFTAAESVDIVEFLMSLDNPSDSVCRAIEGAMDWFQHHSIDSLQRVDFVDSLGRKDYRMVSVPSDVSHRLWARFYTLDTEQPVFCGRDTIPHDRVEDIEHERRTGYAWFVTSPQRLFAKYNKWKARPPLSSRGENSCPLDGF